MFPKHKEGRQPPVALKGCACWPDHLDPGSAGDRAKLDYRAAQSPFNDVDAMVPRESTDEHLPPRQARRVLQRRRSMLLPGARHYQDREHEGKVPAQVLEAATQSRRCMTTGLRVATK
jgi:hypothetical protein